jgi:hypothetical protein
MKPLGLLLAMMLALTSLGIANSKSSDTAIEIKAKIVDDLSSEYFGYFDLEIKNNSDKWIVLRDVEIVFPTDAQSRHIRAISGAEFALWQEVTRKRIAKAELSKNTSLAVIGALGYGLAMASGNTTLQNVGTAAAIGAAGAYTGSEYSKTRDSIHQTKRFPENHLLADSIVILPGLSEGRWLLLNSTSHDSTKLVSEFTVNYKLSDGTRGSNQLKVGKTPWQKSLWWKPNQGSSDAMGIYR